jgi:hypothetical protein
MTLGSLVDTLINFINALVWLLTLVAFLVFLGAGVRYLYKAGDAKGVGKDKYIMQWGLLAMFVLVSIWGIISILKSSLDY